MSPREFAKHRIVADDQTEDLVLPALRKGVRVSEPPSLDDVRARAQAQIHSLHPAIRRLLNPHIYPVGLEMRLHERRSALVLERRQRQPSA